MDPVPGKGVVAALEPDAGSAYRSRDLKAPDGHLIGLHIKPRLSSGRGYDHILALGDDWTDEDMFRVDVILD